MAQEQALQQKAEICRMELLGPSARTEKANPLRLSLGSKPQWRKLVLELRVGSERCPDWDHANICLTAIKDLVKLNDGFMSDAVVEALKTHMDIVSYETFGSRPRA
jgi:hypothetical protein